MNTKQPDLAPLCMQARGFAGQGRIDDAINLYTEVLRIDPTFALAHADRGTVFAMARQFEPALRDLTNAFELGYAEPSAFSTAATVCLETQQYDQALGFYARAVELNADYPFTYYNRSNLHFAMGNREAALADLETCLSMGGADDFRQLVMQRMTQIKQA